MTPVIIPILNGRELTKDCIKSVLAQDVPVEVYVIDNGSNDGSAEMLRAWGDKRVHYVPARRPSVAASWNYGLDYVFSNGATHALVLNNDTLLRPDSVRLLLTENAPFVTCVGNGNPKCVEGPWNLPTNPPRPHPDFSCFLISRECYDKIGRFDEKFIGAYAEDADFHIRMHKAGINAYCIDIPFYHYAAGTIKESADPTGIQTQADKNRAYFKQKWGCEVGSKEYYAMFGHGTPEQTIPVAQDKVHVKRSRKPIVNVVMTSNGMRSKLLNQALSSLFKNTFKDSFTLTLVSDGCTRWEIDAPLVDENTVIVNCHVLSRLKNLGVYWSEQQFDRGDYLLMIDDDVCFMPGWYEKLTGLAEKYPHVALWGGQVHPYHHPVGAAIYEDPMNPLFYPYAMLDGPAYFMPWSTWDAIGPLQGTEQGVCKGEDVNFCNRLVAAGMRIGVPVEHCIIHTGLTNSEGKDAPGRKEREAMIPNGVIAE